MEERHYLTPEGLEKLESELEYLKVTKRAEVSEKIKVARGFGDLSENAEYDAAKDEQAQVEERIAEIEAILRNYEIIDNSGEDDRVRLGSTVELFREKDKKTLTFTIIGSKEETDPFNGKISKESPVGKAILGKSPGETVKVVTPAGSLSYKIVKLVQ